MISYSNLVTVFLVFIYDIHTWNNPNKLLFFDSTKKQSRQFFFRIKECVNVFSSLFYNFFLTWKILLIVLCIFTILLSFFTIFFLTCKWFYVFLPFLKCLNLSVLWCEKGSTAKMKIQPKIFFLTQKHQMITTSSKSHKIFTKE